MVGMKKILHFRTKNTDDNFTGDFIQELISLYPLAHINIIRKDLGNYRTLSVVFVECKYVEDGKNVVKEIKRLFKRFRA